MQENLEHESIWLNHCQELSTLYALYSIKEVRMADGELGQETLDELKSRVNGHQHDIDPLKTMNELSQKTNGLKIEHVKLRREGMQSHFDLESFLKSKHKSLNPDILGVSFEQSDTAERSETFSILSSTLNLQQHSFATKSMILRKNNYFVTAFRSKNQWILQTFASEIRFNSWKKFVFGCFEADITPFLVFYRRTGKRIHPTIINIATHRLLEKLTHLKHCSKNERKLGISDEMTKKFLMLRKEKGLHPKHLLSNLQAVKPANPEERKFDESFKEEIKDVYPANYITNYQETCKKTEALSNGILENQKPELKNEKSGQERDHEKSTDYLSVPCIKPLTPEDPTKPEEDKSKTDAGSNVRIISPIQKEKEPTEQPLINPSGIHEPNKNNAVSAKNPENLAKIEKSPGFNIPPDLNKFSAPQPPIVGPNLTSTTNQNLAAPSKDVPFPGASNPPDLKKFLVPQNSSQSPIVGPNLTPTTNQNSPAPPKDQPSPGVSNPPNRREFFAPQLPNQPPILPPNKNSIQGEASTTPPISAPSPGVQDPSGLNKFSVPQNPTQPQMLGPNTTSTPNQNPPAPPKDQPSPGVSNLPNQNRFPVPEHKNYPPVLRSNTTPNPNQNPPVPPKDIPSLGADNPQNQNRFPAPEHKNHPPILRPNRGPTPIQNVPPPPKDLPSLSESHLKTSDNLPNLLQNQTKDSPEVAPTNIKTPSNPLKEPSDLPKLKLPDFSNLKVQGTDTTERPSTHSKDQATFPGLSPLLVNPAKVPPDSFNKNNEISKKISAGDAFAAKNTKPPNLPDISVSMAEKKEANHIPSQQPSHPVNHPEPLSPKKPEGVSSAGNNIGSAQANSSPDPIFFPGTRTETKPPAPEGIPPLKPQSRLGDIPPPIKQAGQGHIPPPIKQAGQGNIPPPIKQAGQGHIPPPIKQAGQGNIPPPIKQANQGNIPPPIKQAGQGNIPPPIKQAGQGNIPPPIKQAGQGNIPPPIKQAGQGNIPPPIKQASQGNIPPPIRNEKTSQPIISACRPPPAGSRIPLGNDNQVPIKVSTSAQQPEFTVPKLDELQNESDYSASEEEQLDEDFGNIPVGNSAVFGAFRKEDVCTYCQGKKMSEEEPKKCLICGKFAENAKRVDMPPHINKPPQILPSPPELQKDNAKADHMPPFGSKPPSIFPTSNVPPGGHKPFGAQHVGNPQPSTAQSPHENLSAVGTWQCKICVEENPGDRYICNFCCQTDEAQHYKIKGRPISNQDNW